MNNRTLTSVAFADARSGEARIRDEIVHPPRACIIPKPHIMRRKRKNSAHQEPHAAPVIRIHIPDVTHWGVAIAYVASLRRGDYSLCWPRFRTDHQVITTEIKLL